jgi:hypothetical protein
MPGYEGATSELVTQVERSMPHRGLIECSVLLVDDNLELHVQSYYFGCMPILQEDKVGK